MIFRRRLARADPLGSSRCDGTPDLAEDAKKVQVEEPIARLLAGEGSFEGELARFGHGLQRSYLLALLQELASCDDKDAPRLILDARSLSFISIPRRRDTSPACCKNSAKETLKSLCQHTAHISFSGRGFESVRLVRRDRTAKNSKVAQVTFDQISKRVGEIWGEAPDPLPAQRARLQQALQPHLSEMFFTPKLVLVEGMRMSLISLPG